MSEQRVPDQTASRPGSPISRKLMVTFFVVTLVPILGWSVVLDLSEEVYAVTSHLDPGAARSIDAAFEEAHERLIWVLMASLGVFAVGLVYLRNSLIAPLSRLARESSRADTSWEPPLDRHRADEIGTLARALDEGVQKLRKRAERAWLLAADLSHELRTPLSAIVGAAEIIADGQTSPAETSHFAQNIQQESRRLERLVAGILDLERQLPPVADEEARCDLVASIRRVVAALTPLLDRKRLGVQITAIQQATEARVDRDRHDRVVFALLENAIKYSPVGGTVFISVETRVAGSQLLDAEKLAADHARVRISDEGPGIPSEHREAVFQRYNRLSDKVEVRGNGLGLAIVQLLVAQWGGEVGAVDGPASGATFEYTVPLES